MINQHTATVGYVDDYFDSPIEPEDFIPIDENDTFEDIEPIDHHEPPPRRRLAALLARLRKVSLTQWLLVHVLIGSNAG